MYIANLENDTAVNQCDDENVSSERFPIVFHHFASQQHSVHVKGAREKKLDSWDICITTISSVTESTNTRWLLRCHIRSLIKKSVFQ